MDNAPIIKSIPKHQYGGSFIVYPLAQDRYAIIAWASSEMTESDRREGWRF